MTFDYFIICQKYSKILSILKIEKILTPTSYCNVNLFKEIIL